MFLIQLINFKDVTQASSEALLHKSKDLAEPIDEFEESIKVKD